MYATPITALPDDAYASWLSHWRAAPGYATPFLHPAFCRALVTAGSDPLVCHDAALTQFVPVQRDGARLQPAGGRLADYGGCVGAAFSAELQQSLLGATGARSLAFNNVQQRPEAPVPGRKLAAPYVLLDNGVDAWLKALKARGVGTLSQVARKARKLGREVGPLRLEQHQHDDAALDGLLAWKAAQRKATYSSDVFDHQWARRLASAVMRLNADGLQGNLSALYAGDTCVAMHLGLETEQRLHWWVPAYDDAYSRYSPGLILLLELARSVHERGARRIDLGPGEERYKHSVMSAADELVATAAFARTLSGRLAQAGTELRERIRGSGVEAALKSVRSGYRRLRG